MPQTPITLTVAGSDSGGGAGIQADIKAISATGGYACSVITALTAQNTLGVTGVMPVPEDFINQQFDAVFSDLGILAVKIGMLGDAATIKSVAAALVRYQPKFVVLDPVMVATSGDLLLAEEAVETLINVLLPLADVVTPNLHEAQALLGLRGEPLPQTSEQMQQYCRSLMALGCRSVLLKGGHQEGERAEDFWISTDGIQSYSSERVDTDNTHGTGCTLSASIASYLAQGLPMPQAIEQAKAYIHGAICHADELNIGAGSGPVHHFYRLAR
ncbi:bifunctional hydroxymethylpyrimidine kinase/phosphomethylpyrimidine kinase [Motiliproteus sp.]|uniref:bifunctional hydroxymethylpyrimidine kinase/phosphomethylpyrimidine kinase n=1 Tax=Motiliproteus sp. TaxID=1898955 RepID=UPI003BAC52DB